PTAAVLTTWISRSGGLTGAALVRMGRKLGAARLRRVDRTWWLRTVSGGYDLSEAFFGRLIPCIARSHHARAAKTHARYASALASARSTCIANQADRRARRWRAQDAGGACRADCRS